MKGWTIDQARHDRTRSAFGSPGGRERRRGMTVELLLGGFRIPGFIGYSARGDQVTFTIKKVPLWAPGELDPETGGESQCCCSEPNAIKPSLVVDFASSLPSEEVSFDMIGQLQE